MTGKKNHLNLDGRVFAPIENSENGTVSHMTRFQFWQQGDLFFADYNGGDVREGHIIGEFTGDNSGHMLYHCMTNDRELKAGEAHAVFSEISGERLVMDIDWHWLTGDKSSGQSRYEEIK